MTGHVSSPCCEEAVESRQRAAPREVARDAEDDECVGVSSSRAEQRIRRVSAACSTRARDRRHGVRSFAEWTSFVASSVSMVLIGKYP